MISKSTFIRGLQCLKSLYLHKKRPFLRDPLPPEIRKKFKRGHEVGHYARQLFPGGIDLSPSNPKAYKKNMAQVLEHVKMQTPVLYEVPFIHLDLMAIMDIVTFSNGKWNAYEVKSSLSISDTYLWDISFQAHVISAFNLGEVDFHLVHINPDYVMESDIEIHDLFRIVNVNDEIARRIGLLEPLIEKMRETEKLTSSPLISVGQHCDSPYLCDFKGHCWKHVVEPSVFRISEFPADQKFKLLAQGKSDLGSALPYIHDIRQKNVAMSLLHREIIVNKPSIKQYVRNFRENIIFCKVFHHAPAIPLHKYSQPFELTPVMLVLSWLHQGKIEKIKHYFFDAGEDFWERILDFSTIIHSYSQTHTLICYGDSAALIRIGKTLNRIFGFDEIPESMIDLKQVFSQAWYCAPTIDSDFSFKSVASHFGRYEKNEVTKKMKIIREAEDEPYVLLTSLVGRHKLLEAGNTSIQYLFDIFTGLRDVVSGKD
jgi:hypothetical protein